MVFHDHSGIKLEIKDKRDFRNSKNTYKPNSRFWHYQLGKWEKSKEKDEKFLETNENGNTVYQNRGDTAKTVLAHLHQLVPT